MHQGQTSVGGSGRLCTPSELVRGYLAHASYNRLHGLGELSVPSAVFVGSVGGEHPGEIKSFQPIPAFRDKSPDEIAVVLYATPTVSVAWEREIDRRRVRMWTVDHEVMGGWKEQVEPNLDPAHDETLWKWVKDNIDFRVRSKVL